MAKPLAPTPSFLASHLLGCSILWASGFLFMKLAGAVNPFVTASVRGLLGALTHQAMSVLMPVRQRGADAGFATRFRAVEGAGYAAQKEKRQQIQEDDKRPIDERQVRLRQAFAYRCGSRHSLSTLSTFPE